MPSSSYSLVLEPKDVECRTVRIAFDAVRYGRIPHSLTEASVIEEHWQRAVLSRPKLFNGSKFRFDGVEFDDSTVTIRLGLTDYRDYIGTNLRLVDISLSSDYLSNALGCETVFVTGDDRVALLRRSGQVATHCGEYNGPSGHAEPESGKTVEDEVLRSSISEEIFEELGVPDSRILDTRLIGCMRERRTLKPDLLFQTTTDLLSTQITEMFPNAKESWESDRLVFVSVDDLESTDLPLTAVTQAALHCFQLRRRLCL